MSGVTIVVLFLIYSLVVIIGTTLLVQRMITKQNHQPPIVTNRQVKLVWGKTGEGRKAYGLRMGSWFFGVLNQNEV